MSESAFPAVPVVELRIYDPQVGRMRPLPEDLAELLESVTLSEEDGLASEVTLRFRIWDPIAGYVLGNEQALWPGTELELWSGYDVADHCHGLFTIETRDSDYPAGGLPVLEMSAVDGLARTMRNIESFVFENIASELPPIEDIAYRAGLFLEPDLILSGSTVPKGDRAKEIGRTDLEYLKNACLTYGLGQPRVRYTPRPTGQRGDETLVMKRLRVSKYDPATGRRGFDDDQGLHLRYVPKGAEDGGEFGGELASFDSSFDVSGLPVAVEVIGQDRTGATAGQVVRVVVKMTPNGAVVDNETILTEAELKESANQLRNYGKFDPKTIQDGDGFILAMLGAGGEGIVTGTKFNAGTKKKPRRIAEKRWAQEVLYATNVTGADSVREYALAWMQSRYEGFFVCNASLIANLQGANVLAPGQVHYVDGVLKADRGYYLTQQVTHEWDVGSGHSASFSGARVIVEVA